MRIPQLAAILEQVKVHFMYIRGCGSSSSCSSQLPRVMYLLGERKEDVEKELNACLEKDADDFDALQFGALYYEQTSRTALALECCKKALDIMDHPFHSSLVSCCKRRLLSKH